MAPTQPPSKGGAEKKGDKKDQAGVSKKPAKPSKDAKKVPNAKGETENDDEGAMITEEREIALKLQAVKAEKEMNMILGSINVQSKQQDTPIDETAPGAENAAESTALRPVTTATGPGYSIASQSNVGGALTTFTPAPGFSADMRPTSSSSAESSNLPVLLPTVSDKPPDGPPVINLISEEDTPSVVEDPDDAGLFTPDQNKVVTGRSDDGEVVAWRRQGYSKQVIIRYGPKNSPKYERSTKFKAGIPFDENTTPQIGPDHRFGDEKRGRKFVRQWDDFKGIQGVAYNCPLEALMPRKVSGEKKYPRVDVWVKWSIGGQIHRAWEVPSSIKHIWPNPTECEEYIYNAAREHDEKHQEWLSGQRVGKDASPTPGPATTRLMPKGPQATKPVIKVEEGGGKGTASPNPSNSEQESMLQSRRQWAMMEKLDPDNLTMKQKLMFLKAWNEEL